VWNVEDEQRHPAELLPPEQLSGRIQHTLIGQAITEREVRAHVQEALEHGFDAAFVPPCWVWAARDELRDTVARIGSISGPEPGLTVRESIDEQCLLEDVDRQVGRTRFAEACEVMQLSFEPTLLVGRLAGELATLFAVALACVRVSAVILLDDLDRDVSAANQQRMLDALIRVARTGPTIVVTTTDRVPVMEADVVLDLTPRDGAAMWRPGPVIGPSGTMLRQLDPGGRRRDPVDLELESGTIPPPPEPPDSHDEWRDEWRDHQDGGTGDAPTEDQR